MNPLPPQDNSRHSLPRTNGGLPTAPLPRNPNLSRPAPTVPVQPPQQPVQASPPAPVPEATVNPENESEELTEAERLEIAERRRQERLAELSPADSRAAMELMNLLNDDEVTEIFLNSRDNVTFKKNGIRLLRREIQFSTIDAYHNVIDNLLLHYTDTAERLENTEHLIEGLLELPSENGGTPVYARTHVIAPPVKTEAIVSIAKKSKHIYSIDNLVHKGSMTPQMAAFLKACAKARVTMVYSGVSGAGKTTNLEALAQEFDPTDRIILIEDTPELRIPGQDVVSSTSSSMKPGMDISKRITMEWLVQQANRQRPDRIIVGEVRGPEMNEFLVSANSGADGSMTTLHATSARGAISKIISLCMYGDSAKAEEAILRDIASSVQIIVQLNIVDGKQVVSEIVELENAVRQGSVPMNTLYKYNRNTRRHEVAGRPSDALRDYMAERGVQVDMSWFQRPGM